MNKIIKTMLLAGVMLAPVAMSAKAADLSVPAADPAMMGLYLRADAGWSFLNWSGGADDDNFVAGGGIGYRFSENVRADVTADWSGNYTVAPGAEISTTAVLGNLYFDWANSSMFTPYIGVGAGYGWVDGTGGAVDDNGFAVGAAAGVSVDLTNNLALDAGYRFRDIMISGPDSKEHQVTMGLRFSF